MSISAIQLKFLQSVVTDIRARAQSAAAAYYCEEFGIGVKIRRSYEYTVADAERAKNLLHSLKLPLTANEGNGDRADAIDRPGMSEKSGTRSPHEDSVAFKVVDKRPGAMSSIGYQVATADEVSGIECDITLVVENFETFRQIERYKWVMDLLPTGQVTLVLFRGDTIYRVDDAQKALKGLTSPAWGFFDFDPAGLFMCAELERLAFAVIPELEVLEKLSREARRNDLFYDQIDGFRSALDNCQQNQIAKAWWLLKRIGAGLPQEWMRDL